MMSFIPDMPWMLPEVTTGTTIIAAKFCKGVVLAADSRTSCGPFIANRVTDKIAKLTDKIYCLRSGAAADTQMLTDLVSYFLSFTKNLNRGKEPTVKDAAIEFNHCIYQQRNKMVASVLVAGYDDESGGDIYSIFVDGTLLREQVTTGGSGSQYIKAMLQEHWVPNMKLDSCIDLLKRAIFHSMSYDNCSGGVVRIAVITKEGVERRVYYNTPNAEAVFQCDPPAEGEGVKHSCLRPDSNSD